jgi:hypothetical protein
MILWSVSAVAMLAATMFVSGIGRLLLFIGGALAASACAWPRSSEKPWP